MDKERQEEIIKLLTSKGVVKPCPRCSNPQFELVGETSVQLNLEAGPRGVSHPTVPVILLRVTSADISAIMLKGYSILRHR